MRKTPMAGGEILPTRVQNAELLVPISTASVRRSYHKNDLLFLIDFIEESPGPDSISPCFGSEVFEFFDIWAKMGMLA
jgi:hypothetical protein